MEKTVARGSLPRERRDPAIAESCEPDPDALVPDVTVSDTFKLSAGTPSFCPNLAAISTSFAYVIPGRYRVCVPVFVLYPQDDHILFCQVGFNAYIQEDPPPVSFILLNILYWK